MNSTLWRSIVVAFLSCCVAGATHASTPYGYAANVGWIDFAPSATARVAAGAMHLQGLAYAANFGWIDLGDGTPTNGTAYANTSASDYGVNHDGTGRLSGYAYGANIGWINFAWAGASDPNRPRVDLVTGVASGFAYSANVGWIDLTALIMPGVTAAVRFPSDNPTTIAGSLLTLSAGVFGSEALTFQWFFNGVAIPGATGATLTLDSAQRFHAGEYSVRITRADSSTFLVSPSTLAVAAPAPNNARLLNLSTRAQALTGDDVLIPGFVIAGTGSKRLLIRAVGPTLGKPPFNLTGVLPDPGMRLLKRNPATQAFEEIAANDNWATNPNAAAITQTAADLFAFSFSDALESALLMDLSPGEYTVIASGVNNATGIAIVELYDADASTGSGQAPASRLINISNRGFAGLGAQVMIPGFVISSEGPKTVLVRVVGPTLGGFGVGGTMTDPKLEVFPGGASTPVFTNDNWGDNPDATYTAQVASQVFAFPLAAGSKDAAFVVTLPPGSYTVVGSSAVAGGTGVVLVEVYVVP